MARALDEYSQASVLIVPSRVAKQTFVRYGIEPDTVKVIPWGVDLTRLPQLAMPTDRRLRILFLGQVGIRKGIDTLLTACGMLKSTEYDLTVVGDWEPEASRLFARHSDVKVSCLPFTSHYAEQLGRCHVLVLPSREDAFPLVVLEAMASGRAVVISDACGNKEIVEREGGGFVFPSGDAQALATLLSQLVDDVQLRRMSGAAARNVAEKFPWSSFRRAFAELVSQTESAAL